MKYRNITLTILLILGMSTLKAQNISPELGLVFKSENTTNTTVEGQDILTDATGNVYTTGYFKGTADLDPSTNTTNLNSMGGDDIFLAKYNNNGEYQWAISIGGVDDDEGLAIALDASNNIYITGFFKETADFDPSVNTANLSSMGEEDIFVAKYNSDGEYQWAFNLGDSRSDEGLGIAVDASNNIYITGLFEETTDFDPSVNTANLSSVGGEDIFVAKYNSSGDYQWAFNIGDSSNEEGLGIAFDASNNVYLTGYFRGTADFDPSANVANLTSNGDRDVFLAKYNSNGDYQWAFGIGGTSSDYSYDISVDGSNNVFIIGYFFNTIDFDPSGSTADLTSNGSSDVFVAKYNSNGEYQWAFNVGGTSVERSFSIALDASDNVYITGHFFSTTIDFDPSGSTADLTSNGGYDIFVAKYDNNGDYQWAFNVGGTGADLSFGIALDASDNVHIIGYFSTTADFDPSTNTSNLVNDGSNDVFIAKYNSNSTYQWAYNVGASIGESEFVQEIKVDDLGNMYVLGTFYSIVDFDPSANIANLTSNGSADIFLAKYNSLGEYQWAFNIGGTSGDFTYAMTIDASANVYVTGSFNNTVDFDPSASTADLTSNGNTDVFVAKYNNNGDYQWAFSLGGTSSETNNGIAVDASGNVYITGHFYSSSVDFDPSGSTADINNSGSADIFVAKYGNNGNYLWAFSLASSNSDTSGGIAIDGSGNVCVTGQFFSSTIDFDPSTNTASLTSGGRHDFFVAKYNSNGDYLWAFNIGNGDDEYGAGIALDASDNIYILGRFESSTDFDPSTNTASRTSAGVGDVFVAKYNSNGDYLWAISIEATNNDYPYDIALDASSNVYITGFFLNTADFDPSTGTANITSAGSSDVFMAKYTSTGTYEWAMNLGSVNNESGYAVEVDASGYMYFGGYFFGVSANVHPNGTFILEGGDDTAQGFVVKYAVCNPPTAQATTLVASSTAASITLSSFTAPSSGADGYTIYINDTNSFTAPNDGDEPTTNLSWNGSGQQAVYFGTSDSPGITITNLSPSTDYYIMVYAYTNCSHTETYEVTGFNSIQSTSSTYVTKTNGNWQDTSSWMGEIVPTGIYTDVDINHSITLTAEVDLSTLTVGIDVAGGSLDLNSNNILLGSNSGITAGEMNIDDNSATDENNKGGYIEATNKVVNKGASATDIAGLGLTISDVQTSSVSISNIKRYHYKADLGLGDPILYDITGTIGGTCDLIITSNHSIGSTMYKYTALGWEVSTGDDLSGGFSLWTTSDAPLPISLLYFEAERANDREVLLTWATASEKDNLGFEIQMSKDGQNFEKLGFVEGQGNSSSVRSYEFLMNNSESGYYRLKQIDFDGSFEYSDLRFVKGIESNLTLKVYPNPSQGEIQIDIPNYKDEIKIRVFNTQGKEILNAEGREEVLNEKLNHIFPNLENGLYIFKVQVLDKVWTQRIILHR